MIESSHYIHLPGWAKAASIAILVSGLLTATYLVFHYTAKGDMTDHTLSALAVAQLAATGLVISFILFFSERELSATLLLKKTDGFLEKDLLNAFQRITVKEDDGDILPVNAKILDKADCIDQFGRVFDLSSPKQTLRMWVGLNVNRILVLYFTQLPDDKTPEQVGEEFMITFSGAKSVGYNVDYLSAKFPGENIVCIRASCILGDDDFLGKPSQKLFWANDVALMTQSLFRTAVRNDIPTYTNVLPHPI